MRIDEDIVNPPWLQRGGIFRMISLKRIIIYGSLAPFFAMLTLLYILGVARYVTDFEENTCDMTYMFEYPQYVRISLKNDIEQKYLRFGLYAYGEGPRTENLRSMHFSGIPVLFIPGNAGSHEQVRSIASVSLRKSLKKKTPFHFDFFTVSFNKDYSALYGGVLMEQTVYVSHCIKAILALYKGKINNVVLIGHSMGGIVAKGALLLAPNMSASFASMIINLASPHTPSLILDSLFANYYYELEKQMYKIKDAGVKVVSIGGGPRDILVPAAQTFDHIADINVLSTSIPVVWKSTDHLSILWCKQLVFVIVRSLFDSVDHMMKPPQITSDPNLKMQSLSYHFLQHTSGKKLYHYAEKVRFEADGEWINVPQQYVWSNKNMIKKSSNIYLVVELFQKSDFLTIDAINLQNKDWLFVCSAFKKQGGKQICEWGWNLTNKTRLLPDPLYRSRKTIDLDLKKIKYPYITHAIVKITPDDLEKHLIVNFDSYFYNNRIESTKNRFLHPRYLFGFRGPNLIETVKGSVRYYITLPNIIDVITIELKSPNCLKHYAIVELLESSNIGSSQSEIFTNTDDGPKTLKIQTLYRRYNDTASLRLTLEPECIYTVNIQPGGIIDKISCRIRDRWPLLYMAIISLLLLFVSMRIHYNSDTLPTIAVTIILSFVFNVTYEMCIALCIIGISAIGVCCSVVFLGSVAHGIAVRFLARAITFSVTWSDWLLNGLNQLPLITTVFILSLIPTTCGALGVLISVFLYFLKLTRMYEDYLEDILMAPLQHFDWFKRLKIRIKSEENDGSISERIYDHLILFLLCCFTAIPAIPSVLVWAKNFSYDMRLSTEDPVLMISWIIIAACSNLGIVQISLNHKGYRSLILANILRFTSWVILSTTAAPRPSFYQWCMPPIIAAGITLVTLNSLIPHRQFS
ncbi:GPI inositol-deacylase-like isoform X2 [Cardiocondyla obscurior]|uniref:GPI inositol-deacylase-like isoform X2 n=1 Tax=Cardiocondyla obscurior TaxID=286306 RepID=UPI00396561A8